MPLGARDVLLIIRARDAASRELREVSRSMGLLGGQASTLGTSLMTAGGAMTALGTGMAAAGAAGLSWFNQATDAAIKYSNQVSHTLTQVDNIAVSFQDLHDLGMRVADAIPRPLEEAQAGLFDIFSSMDVNLKDAETLIMGFSKAAVAGQTDIRSAARNTISVLNAFNIPASDVNRVLDVQFELVRKGIAEYDELVTTMGQAIPAWGVSNQSIEGLAGAMAFLTRNSLTVPRAATSAARAMELVATPKAVKNLEELGVQVRDASGNFLPMVDIMRQLARDKGWERLAGPDLRKAFTEVFGTGSIQARRFFDLVFKNFDEYESLTQEMFTSAGAMEAAYKIMFEDPAQQVQLLKNQYELLKIEVGEELIPAKLKLMQVLRDVIKWFRELPPDVKRTIVLFAAGAAAAMVLFGAIFILAGAMLMLLGLIMLLSSGAGLAALATLLGVAVALAGLAALAVVAWKNWDKISEIWQDKVVPAAKAVWEWLKRLWDTLFEIGRAGAKAAWGGIQAAWAWIYENAPKVWQAIQSVWDKITEFFVDLWHDTQRIWDNILNFLRDTWADIKQIASTIWQEIQKAWDTFLQGAYDAWITYGMPVVMAIVTAWDAASRNIRAGWETLKREAGEVWQAVQQLWDEYGVPTINQIVDFWNNLAGNLAQAWQLIRIQFQMLWNRAQETWDKFSGPFAEAWQFFWNQVGKVAAGVWNALGKLWQAFVNTLSGIFQIFAGILTLNWSTFWRGIRSVAEGMWNFLQAKWTLILTLMRAAWATFSAVLGATWRTFWAGVQNSFASVMAVITAIFRGVWTTMRAIWEGAKGIWSGMWEDIKGPVNLAAAAINAVIGVLRVLKSLWETLANMADIHLSVSVSTPGLSNLQKLGNLLTNPLSSVIRRQTGGSVFAGGVYQIGGGGHMRAPELFIPRTSGYMVGGAEMRRALSGMGGGGEGVTINGNIVIQGGGSAEENLRVFQRWLDEVATEYSLGAHH